MDTTTSETLTKIQIEALRDALQHYYGGLLGLPDAKDIDGKWFDWKNKKQFLNEISKIFGIDVSPENINRDLADKIYVDLTNLENSASKTVEFKEAEESPVTNTIANIEVRDETAIKSNEERQVTIKRDTEESNRMVRQAIEQKQKNQAELEKRERIQANIKEKQNEFKSEIEQAKITKEQLGHAPDKKVWVRVTKPEIAVSSTISQTEVDLYNENVKTIFPSIITNKIIQTPGVLNSVVPDKNGQLIIEKANLESTNAKLAQHDLYIHLLNSQAQLDLRNIKVEVSETPQTSESGFVEVNATQLFEEQVSSHIESLQSQDETLNNLSSHVKDYGIDSGKSFLLEKAGNKLAIEVVKLPGDSFARKAYESKFGQFALSQAGLVTPTQYAALTDSFTGDLIVASGYGELGGFIQSTTGLKLGLIEVGPNGVDMFAPGVIGGITAVGVKAWAAQTTVTYTGLAEQAGNYMLADAFGGGAMQSAVTKTVAQTGKQSLNMALGTAVAKGASSLALKLGFTAASAKIGAAIGTGIIPVIGTIVGAVLGAVFGKLIQKFGPQIKRFFNEYGKYFLGFGAVAGLMGAPLLAAPLLVIGGASVLAGGIGFGGFFGGLFGLFGAIGRALMFTIGWPVIIGIITFPLLVALILFIINSGAYIVPHHSPDSPFTDDTPFPIVCTTEKGPVGLDGPFSPSPIGNRAWEITYDLYQGFWCFWNRSPSNNPWNGPPRSDFPNDIVKYPPNYPKLFDYSLFKSNPNPSASSGPNLFWCTWLVVKAYQENGNNIGTNLYTPDMYNDFNNREKIVDAKDASISTVPPGSVVFFHVTTGQNRLNHVGVVYATDRAGIDMVQSNAPTKKYRIPFAIGGVGIVNNGPMQVKYFGTP